MFEVQDTGINGQLAEAPRYCTFNG